MSIVANNSNKFSSSNTSVYVLFYRIKTTFNRLTDISCHSSGLVSVYQKDNGKLPSPRNRVTIASLCWGNVITIATSSEFKTRFLNYSCDYQFETWLTYSLTTAAPFENIFIVTHSAASNNKLYIVRFLVFVASPLFHKSSPKQIKIRMSDITDARI